MKLLGLHAACCALALCSSSAVAASITAAPLEVGSDVTIVSIEGSVEDGDLAKFKKIAASLDRGVVLLNSPGGRTLEALEIGKVIRIKGLFTFVMDGSECNSACALIWAAGERRFLSPSAKVGFHASYTSTPGAKQESGVGNAVVGSYLNSLGYSQSAVVFATSAPPSRLNWLTLDNATQVGITAERIDPDKNKAEADKSTSMSTVYAQFSDGWTVTREQTACVAMASYTGNTLLSLTAQAGNNRGLVIVTDPAFKSIVADRIYKIAVTFFKPGGKIDNGWGELDAVGIKESGITGFRMVVDSGQFLDDIRASESLVMMRGESIVESLPLKGSALAVAKLQECSKEVQRARALDPFAD